MQFKRGKSADWLTNSDILAAGQPALEYNQDGSINIKVGDGEKTFSQLPYLNAGIMSKMISDAIRDLGIPSKTSDLNNDSNFVDSTTLASALRGYATTNELLTLSNQIPNLSGILTNNNFTERGSVESNTGYSVGQAVSGSILDANYYLIGDFCIVYGSVSKVSGYKNILYSLPVAAKSDSSTICSDSDSTYVIYTSTANNITSLNVKEINNDYLTNGSLYFTIIYKYK